MTQKTLKVGILYNRDDISLVAARPFRKPAVLTSYERLSEIGRAHGITFVFSKPAAYRRGSLSAGRMFLFGAWQRLRSVPIDVVYDKFSFTPLLERLRKRIAKEVTLVNHLSIERVCKDKWLMYRAFSSVSVPTFRVGSRRSVLAIARRNGWRRVVLKPRFGVGGEGVEIVRLDDVPNRLADNTLLQPFIDTRTNTVTPKKKANDVRVVVINGKIDHAYVREAQSGLRSNVALGGRVKHISLAAVSVQIKKKLRVIDHTLTRYHPRIYTADFLVDRRGRAWLGEMNSQPAFYLYFGVTGKRVQARFFNNLCMALKNSKS